MTTTQTPARHARPMTPAARRRATANGLAVLVSFLILVGGASAAHQWAADVCPTEPTAVCTILG